MDRVGVHCNIHKVHTDTPHVLLAEWSLLANPLPCAVNVLLDLKKILNTLRLVNNEVGTIGLRAPCPDLGCIVCFPTVFVLQQLCSLLRVCLWTKRALLDLLAYLLIHWFCNQVNTVVLVGRFGQACL